MTNVQLIHDRATAQGFLPRIAIDPDAELAAVDKKARTLAAHVVVIPGAVTRILGIAA